VVGHHFPVHKAFIVHRPTHFPTREAWDCKMQTSLAHTHTFHPGWWSQSLKNISQMGLLFPIYGKIKFMFQTTNQTRFITFPCTLLAALSVHKRQFLKSAQIPFSDRARDFALAHLAGLGPVKPPFLKCSLLEVLKQKQLIEMAKILKSNMVSWEIRKLNGGLQLGTS